MVQILNITDVRNRLGNLVESVAREGKKVVIVRDSVPEAVLIPYDEYTKSEESEGKQKKTSAQKLDPALVKWANKFVDDNIELFKDLAHRNEIHKY